MVVLYVFKEHKIFLSSKSRSNGYFLCIFFVLSYHEHLSKELISLFNVRRDEG